MFTCQYELEFKAVVERWSSLIVVPSTLEMTPGRGRSRVEVGLGEDEAIGVGAEVCRGT